MEKLLIVEKDLDKGEVIKKYLIDHDCNMDAINVISDAKKLNNAILAFKPNYLLIELETKNLKNLNFINDLDTNETKVLIHSKNVKLINSIDQAYYKKIKKIYVKPYALSILCNDLMCMSCDDSNTRLRIEKEISNFNFNKGSKGYRYLIEGLLYVNENPRIMKTLRKI